MSKPPNIFPRLSATRSWLASGKQLDESSIGSPISRNERRLAKKLAKKKTTGQQPVKPV